MNGVKIKRYQEKLREETSCAELGVDGRIILINLKELE
jgi:hypothetical protein